MRGSGRLDWRLWGWLPAHSANGPALDRTLLVRWLAGEEFCLVCMVPADRRGHLETSWITVVARAANPGKLPAPSGLALPDSSLSAPPLCRCAGLPPSHAAQRQPAVGGCAWLRVRWVLQQGWDVQQTGDALRWQVHCACGASALGTAAGLSCHGMAGMLIRCAPCPLKLDRGTCYSDPQWSHSQRSVHL